MANHMKQVAEMLGVELWEEFKVDGNSLMFYLDQHGLAWTCGDAIGYDNELLCNILNGSKTIKKHPWLPKNCDIYFVPNPYMERMFETRTWTGCNIDNSILNHNLCCKTTEEALEKAKKMLAAIKED